MDIETTKKLVRICRELTKEEREELFFMLKDEVAPTMNLNVVRRKYPSEATEIQYNGKIT